MVVLQHGCRGLLHLEEQETEPPRVSHSYLGRRCSVGRLSAPADRPPYGGFTQQREAFRGTVADGGPSQRYPRHQLSCHFGSTGATFQYIVSNSRCTCHA